MRLSIVIVTHNRRDALSNTLAKLARNPALPHDSLEVLVVDNASTDDTPEMLAAEYPRVRVIRRRRNEGVSARNHAFAVARGAYVMLIDDDSYPLEDAAERSMAFLDENPDTAAVVGRVLLRDGSAEASALPGVIINCGVVLRRSVLDEIGGFPVEFFRQAEEYDLSFRIWHAGHHVERFEDVLYRHEKVAGNRAAPLVHRLDLRNNLILAERYLPTELRRAYRQDWMKRYTALARHAGCGWAARRARLEGRVWSFKERFRGRRVLNEEAIESIFHLQAQRSTIDGWSKVHGLSRVVIADFSKNLYATHRACVDAGLDVRAIYDRNPAFAGMKYRGVPVTNELPAAEGIVVSNINPAQVERRVLDLCRTFDGPILRLWHPRNLGSRAVPQPIELPQTQELRQSA